MPAGYPVVTSLLTALAAVPDHRRAAGRRHSLPAVLTFVCCGMLCGGRSLLAIAEWGRAHEGWCCVVFGFRRRTPCVSTLHRILTGLDVGAFETALRTWIEPQLEAPITLESVAIDGKAVRGAKEQHLPGAYLLQRLRQSPRRGASATRHRRTGERAYPSSASAAADRPEQCLGNR